MKTQILFLAALLAVLSGCKTPELAERMELRVNDGTIEARVVAFPSELDLRGGMIVDHNGNRFSTYCQGHVGVDWQSISSYRFQDVRRVWIQASVVDKGRVLDSKPVKMRGFWSCDVTGKEGEASPCEWVEYWLFYPWQ